MQNNYTSAIQTANVNIPGGLTEDMTSLKLDIKVDKLENSQSSGQVYFELFNPTTGKSYGVEKGDDFALEDKEWHKDYTVSLKSFGLPSDVEELSQITVLKIGRKPVGGGNNNRRAKIYLENISFMAEEPVPTAKLPVTADMVFENNATLPNGATVNAEQINYMFDGDISEINVYTPGRQKRVYLDLGREYQIDRIVVTEYGMKEDVPAGTLEIFGGTTSPEGMESFDATLFKQVLRTRNQTANGVATTVEDITNNDQVVIGRTSTAHEVYQSSDFDKVRYIVLCDWSNAPRIAELEIYVVDDGTVPTPVPTATPTVEPTATPTATPTVEPTATPTAEPTATPTVEPSATPDASTTTPPTENPEFTVEFAAPQQNKTGITIPVNVTGEGSCEAVIYVVEYADGRLIAVRAIYDTTITESQNIDIECSLSGEVKVFIWDKSQKPVWETMVVE